MKVGTDIGIIYNVQFYKPITFINPNKASFSNIKYTISYSPDKKLHNVFLIENQF